MKHKHGLKTLELGPDEKRGATAVGASATGAATTGFASLGAVAIGALAFGALALGALAVGRLWIGKAHIRKLRIDELEIGRVTRRHEGDLPGRPCGRHRRVDPIQRRCLRAGIDGRRCARVRAEAERVL